MHGLWFISLSAYLHRMPNMFGINVSGKISLVILEENGAEMRTMIQIHLRNHLELKYMSNVIGYLETEL